MSDLCLLFSHVSWYSLNCLRYYHGAYVQPDRQSVHRYLGLFRQDRIHGRCTIDIQRVYGTSCTNITTYYLDPHLGGTDKQVYAWRRDENTSTFPQGQVMTWERVIGSGLDLPASSRRISGKFCSTQGVRRTRYLDIWQWAEELLASYLLIRENLIQISTVFPFLFLNLRG